MEHWFDMLNFNTVKAKLFVVLIVLLIANTSHAAENIDLVDRIKNLGKDSGYETDTGKQAEDFYILSKNKKTAVLHLLEELKPIKESNLSTELNSKNAEGLHVVWCIRALRFFTGCMFFTEKAKDRFAAKDQIRIMLLTQKKDNEYTFFAASAARDKIYIAPIYAQKVIIKKWNEWFKQNGEGFEYKTCKDVSIWCE